MRNNSRLGKEYNLEAGLMCLWRIKGAWALVLLIMICFNFCFVPQGHAAKSKGYRIGESYRNNVVQLTALLSDGGSQDGFGFVIGGAGKRLYVVTAGHVVRSEEPGERVRKVLAQFNPRKGRSYKADVLDLAKKGLDLALLEVPRPEGYQWKGWEIDSRLDIGDEVWFIGREKKWYIPLRPGLISQTPSRINNVLIVETTRVRPGTSGTPLFTEDGIVGMIVQDNMDEVFALGIEAVKEVVSREWNYSWQLERSDPTTYAVREDSTFSVTAATPKKGDVWTDPFTGMEFVWAPKGCYEMGCGPWAGDCYDDEKPVHKVCLDGFWIGKYEVTQGQWKKIMGSNPSGFKKGNKYPVETVSWDDARKFIKKLNEKTGKTFRLPTEAEWEYACRSGGKEEKYSGGRDISKVAWYDDNSGSSTHPVGKKAANGLGIYDMSGNVWEWVEDDRHYDYKGAPADGSAWVDEPRASGRVLRGGCWVGDAGNCRAAVRFRLGPGRRYRFSGFRLVLLPGHQGKQGVE